MPRRKTVDDGHETNRNARVGTLAVGGSSAGVYGVPGIPTISRSEEQAGRAFQELLERTDGWLRGIPAGDGKLSYFKWKFNSGPHTGKYVMYVAHGFDWVDGICGLLEKLEAVDRGERRPALDTFYDPR